MTITNVEWVQDLLGHAALDLRVDGRQAHFRSSQSSSLLDRGILRGISFLKSERWDPKKNAFIRGSYGPALSDTELLGCTDDPEVYALFIDMCGAIRDGSWAVGVRPKPA